MDWSMQEHPWPVVHPRIESTHCKSRQALARDAQLYFFEKSSIIQKMDVSKNRGKTPKMDGL